MTGLTLTLDQKNRISLTKLLKFKGVDSVNASVLDNGDIILTPMVSIPASEKWLYENEEALKSVKKGLSEKGAIDRGSFSQFVE